MILSVPRSVITGEPDCQNTRFPLPVTVILLQEPSRVTVLTWPRMATALPLQVKVRVSPFPVTTIGTVLTGEGVTLGGIAVGGAIVGDGTGVSEGNGSVGTGVAVSAGSGVDVVDGSGVFVDNRPGVLDAAGGRVFAGMRPAVPVG